MSTNYQKKEMGIFQAFAHEIGLDAFKVEAVESADYGYRGLYLHFSLDIKSRLTEVDGAEDFIEKNLRPVMESIRNSPTVKDALSELNSKIGVLEKTLDRTMAERDALKPFEQYYNLALQMAHGPEKKV